MKLINSTKRKKNIKNFLSILVSLKQELNTYTNNNLYWFTYQHYKIIITFKKNKQKNNNNHTAAVERLTVCDSHRSKVKQYTVGNRFRIIVVLL